MSARQASDRARCPYCGRRYALDKEGKIRKHRMRDAFGSFYKDRRVCGGSGHYPTAGSGS